MESYAAGETSPPLLEETIGANLERIVGQHGDREALVEVATGRRWTYAELDRDVDALARGLLAAGIAKGDRVGIWAPNCAEWTLVQYATAKVGAILVNVNPAYRTHELAFALQQSGLRLLFSATDFKTSDYRVDGRGGPASRRPPWNGSSTSAPTTGTRSSAGGRDLPDDALARRMGTLEPTDPINIQYTSGTTGFPKGATLSHRNILNNGFFVTETIHFTEQDRLAIPVPFYHCFGMVMGNLGCTTHGACMVIPAPGFDPAVTLRAVQDERCTGVYGVPTMFIAMQNHPDFASLRPLVAAHRHHGRLDLPGRGDEALRRRHAHGRGVDRLRHDRDLAGVDARPWPTTTSSVAPRPSAGSTRTWRSRSSTR